MTVIDDAFDQKDTEARMAQVWQYIENQAGLGATVADLTFDEQMMVMQIGSGIERWEPVPGWSHYEASTEGRVRSIDRTIVDANGHTRHLRGKVLSANSAAGNIPSVRLVVASQGLDMVIHVKLIIAATFLNHPIRSPGRVINVNGDITDNRVSNLKVNPPKKERGTSQ